MEFFGWTPLRNLPFAGAFSLFGVENRLAHPDRFGRNVDEFVLGNPLEGLFERHLARDFQRRRVVLAGRAVVGQGFLLRRIARQVVATRVFADDLARIDSVGSTNSEARAWRLSI